MTPKQKQIFKKYIRVVKIADKWDTYLQIDHQGFSVVEQTTLKRARWFGKQLAAALEKLISDNQDIGIDSNK